MDCSHTKATDDTIAVADVGRCESSMLSEIRSARPDLLEAIRNPKHPRHEDMLEWVGGEFDPERFDLDAVNAKLAPAKRTRAA